MFGDCCDVLWRCGHTEKAVALVQGMLEFNIMSPQVLEHAPHDEQLSFFEAFWGSTAPRIGEEGASGWSKWIEEKGNIEPYNVKTTKGIQFIIALFQSKCYVSTHLLAV